jgi:hypothetical protein
VARTDAIYVWAEESGYRAAYDTFPQEFINQVFEGLRWQAASWGEDLGFLRQFLAERVQCWDWSIAKLLITDLAKEKGLWAWPSAEEASYGGVRNYVLYNLTFCPGDTTTSYVTRVEELKAWAERIGIATHNANFMRWFIMEVFKGLHWQDAPVDAPVAPGICPYVCGLLGSDAQRWEWAAAQEILFAEARARELRGRSLGEHQPVEENAEDIPEEVPQEPMQSGCTLAPLPPPGFPAVDECHKRGGVADPPRKDTAVGQVPDRGSCHSLRWSPLQREMDSSLDQLQPREEVTAVSQRRAILRGWFLGLHSRAPSRNLRSEPGQKARVSPPREMGVPTTGQHLQSRNARSS